MQHKQYIRLGDVGRTHRHTDSAEGNSDSQSDVTRQCEHTEANDAESEQSHQHRTRHEQVRVGHA